MNCNELESYLHEFIDNALARDKRNEVANHLAACRRCAVRVAEIERAERELRSLQTIEPPPDFVQAVRRKIREQEQDSQAAMGEAVATRESLWDAVARRLSVPMWLRVPLAAAAAIVLLFAIVTLIQSQRKVRSFDVAELPTVPPAKELAGVTPAAREPDWAGAGAGTSEKREAKSGAESELLVQEGSATAEGVVEPVAPAELPKFKLAERPTVAEPSIALRTTPPAGQTGFEISGKAGQSTVTKTDQNTLSTTPEPSNAPAVVATLPTAPAPTPPLVDAPPPSPKMAKGPAKKSAEPFAKVDPAAMKVPPGLQSGWLDLATRNFYPGVGSDPETGAFVRGYLDARGKFKLLSTQVEGKVAELDARQVAAKGTPGWLALSTQDFVPARPGLKPSFPYIEGYQDNQGEFHPTSRRISKAKD